MANKMFINLDLPVVQIFEHLSTIFHLISLTILCEPRKPSTTYAALVVEAFKGIKVDFPG